MGLDLSPFATHLTVRRGQEDLVALRPEDVGEANLQNRRGRQGREGREGPSAVRKQMKIDPPLAKARRPGHPA